jgi:hypothetical protein
MNKLHDYPATAVVFRWKFSVLLVSLLVQLMVSPLVDDKSPWAIVADLPLAAVFFASIFALFQRKKSRAAALALGIPSIVGVFARILDVELPPVYGGIVYHLIPIVFLFYTVLAILKAIFRDGGVSADSINGAFCGYVLLGIAFGHIYCLIEIFNPDSFTLQHHLGELPISPGDRQDMLTYFSLVTMTTLGYGDILPFSPAARTWATIEVMVGQFYVAAIVAELIGLKVSTALTNNPRQRSPLEFAADHAVHGDVGARVAANRPESRNE